MRTYTCRPPVVAYTRKPKVKHSADRKAHDALFAALQRFCDSLTPAQREAFNANPEEAARLNAAYEAAAARYYGRE